MSCGTFRPTKAPAVRSAPCEVTEKCSLTVDSPALLLEKAGARLWPPVSTRQLIVTATLGWGPSWERPFTHFSTDLLTTRKVRTVIPPCSRLAWGLKGSHSLYEPGERQNYYYYHYQSQSPPWDTLSPSPVHSGVAEEIGSRIPQMESKSWYLHLFWYLQQLNCFEFQFSHLQNEPNAYSLKWSVPSSRSQAWDIVNVEKPDVFLGHYS